MDCMPRTGRQAPSLLTRIILAVTATVLLVSSFHAVYMYSTQRAELIEAMRHDVNESLQRLSKNIGPFIEAYSVTEYENLVATEITLKEHFAVVVDDQEMSEIVGKPYLTGQIFSEAGNYIPYLPETSAIETRLSQAFYSDVAPVHASNGDIIGQVSVYASGEVITKKLADLLIKELLMTLAFSLTLTLLLVVVLRRYFLRSISCIDSAMRNCDHDGIPTEPMPDFPYREIGALSQTINAMLASIKESKEKRRIQQLRLENAIAGTQTGTWEWNVSTGEVVFNERWAQIIGYSLKELAPVSIETWTTSAHPDDLLRSSELLNKHFQGELPYYECETRMRHKDGRWIWVLDRGSVLSWTDDGQPLMMYGTHQDISARKEVESKLSMAAGVFKYAQEGILITSAEGIILDVNSAFSSLTGYARKDVAQQGYKLLASNRHRQEFFRRMLRSLLEEGVWSGEYWMPCQNGDVFPSLLTIAAVRNNAGEVQHYVTLIADISSLKKNEERLHKIAHYDSLTGLPNRVLLTERLRYAVSMARRRSDTLAVVFLDLDGFKAVNDTCGHAAGDEFLSVLAGRMKDTLRECDTVARLGGDEFVVLLPDLSDSDDCGPVLTRLLEALSTPVTLGTNHVQVSASLGVSLYPQDPEVDADILLRQADMAMYQAKQHGKNQYRFFEGVSADSFDAAQAPIPPTFEYD